MNLACALLFWCSSLAATACCLVFGFILVTAVSPAALVFLGLCTFLVCASTIVCIETCSSRQRKHRLEIDLLVYEDDNVEAV